MRGSATGRGVGRALLGRVVLDAGVAAIFVLVGFGVWSFVQGDESRSSGIIGKPSPGGPPLSLNSSLPAIGSSTPAGPPEGSGATTGASAVERYLTAEEAGDTDGSFLLLSAADRVEHDSPAKWQRDHGSLPTITAHTLGAVDETADRVTIAVSLELVSTLDLVTGAVPAHADGTWVAVREFDAWYVSLADSTTTPRWPADAIAADVARAWAVARQRCTIVDQFDSLVGSPTLADQLCNTTEALTLGPLETLDPVDGSAVVAAFGDEATEWARVVLIDGPHPLRAVLAPLGDDWVVVGVLPPTP